MSASDPTVTSLGAGRYLVVDGTRRRIAYAVAGQDASWVFIDGGVYVIETQATARTRSRHGGEEAALSSPMPATVVLVNAAPGQQVAAGDLLVMLEAMKMELPITAPRDGRVKSVECRRGDLVQPGVPLLALEPEREPEAEPEPEHEPRSKNPDA
jgi:acetyl/propionyl-CoA carboxylase alpha subunit